MIHLTWISDPVATLVVTSMESTANMSKVSIFMPRPSPYPTIDSSILRRVYTSVYTVYYDDGTMHSRLHRGVSAMLDYSTNTLERPVAESRRPGEARTFCLAFCILHDTSFEFVFT